MKFPFRFRITPLVCFCISRYKRAILSAMDWEYAKAVEKAQAVCESHTENCILSVCNHVQICFWKHGKVDSKMDIRYIVHHH